MNAKKQLKEGLLTQNPVLVQLMPDKVELPAPFIDIGYLPCICAGGFQDAEQLLQVSFRHVIQASLSLSDRGLRRPP